MEKNLFFGSIRWLESRQRRRRKMVENVPFDKQHQYFKVPKRKHKTFDGWRWVHKRENERPKEIVRTHFVVGKWKQKNAAVQDRMKNVWWLTNLQSIFQRPHYFRVTNTIFSFRFISSIFLLCFASHHAIQLKIANVLVHFLYFPSNQHFLDEREKYWKMRYKHFDFVDMKIGLSRNRSWTELLVYRNESTSNLTESIDVSTASAAIIACRITGSMCFLVAPRFKSKVFRWQRHLSLSTPSFVCFAHVFGAGGRVCTLTICLQWQQTNLSCRKIFALRML